MDLKPFTGDSALIRAIQGGLPMVERPFAAIAADLGWTEEAVIERIRALQAQGAIKRLGVVVRHQELGYGANAMVVWDLPDAQVDALGQRIGALPFVTLCYRRPRRPPNWPYNLFTMIHGRDHAAVLAQVEDLKRDLELAAVPSAMLFSGRRFKQRGAIYRPDSPEMGQQRMDPRVPESLTPPLATNSSSTAKPAGADRWQPSAAGTPGRAKGSKTSFTPQVKPKPNPIPRPILALFNELPA